jgi:hypothetical protein
MSSTFSLPENCKIVEMVAPTVGGVGVVTSDYISLKYAHKAWIVIHYTDGNGNAVSYQPVKATGVTPVGNVSITTAVKIWSNMDTAASDLLVERTAATVYAQDNAVKNKVIVFEINPVELGPTYDVIAFTASTPAAGEYIQAMCYIQPRYETRVLTSPSAIID